MWWIPAAISMFGGILGQQAGKSVESLGRDQQRLADENALLAKRELQEQVRRQDLEDRRLLASALARGAASGAVVASGSIAAHLLFMETEQERQLNWMKTAGASKIRLQLQADKLRASATILEGKTQQWSSMLKGIGGAFSYADQGGAFAKGGMFG